jgi:ABC-type amino acid transport substrate-binding protein
LRTRFAERFTGDFDAMLDPRLIRLVVPDSRTLFFEDKGTIYGTAANGAQLFEGWVNKTFALGARPLTVPLTPVSRDKLFDTLLVGDGDIAAGDITISDELRKKVAFSLPVISNVREIVITGEDVPELDSAEALSGREVAVARSTSYLDQLLREPDETERTAHRPGQAASHHHHCSRHAGGRRPNGDDGCRVVACHCGK